MRICIYPSHCCLDCCSICTHSHCHIHSAGNLGVQLSQSRFHCEHCQCYFLQFLPSLLLPCRPYVCFICLLLPRGPYVCFIHKCLFFLIFDFKVCKSFSITCALHVQRWNSGLQVIPQHNFKRHLKAGVWDHGELLVFQNYASEQ